MHSALRVKNPYGGGTFEHIIQATKAGSMLKDHCSSSEILLTYFKH